MDDEIISGQQVEAPGSAAPATASTAEPKPQENQPLTMADVERIAEEKATRIAQSLVDKAEYRIGQKAQEQIKALEINKGVLGLTDQQVQEAKQKIIVDELTAQRNEPPSPSPVSQGQAPASDPVIEFIGGIFSQQGTTVSKTDAEWASIQKVLDETWNDGSPAAIGKVTAVVTKAAQDKAARIASNQENAAARVGGGGAGITGNPDDPNAPAISLWKAGYKK